MEFNFDPTFNIYQIVSGALGIGGFFMSLIQLVLRQHEKRRDIDFCIVRAEQQAHLFLLTYWAENKSTIPISIINVQLIFNGKAYDILYEPVISKTDPISTQNPPSIYKESSDKTPVLLSPHVAHGGYMAFKIPNEISKNIEKPTLVISTSVGKPIKYTFSLSKSVSIKKRARPISSL